jgi:hypothetical protein
MKQQTLLKLFVLALLIQSSLSCSCAFGTLEESIKSVRNVFLGKVIKIIRASQLRRNVTFKVMQQLKGKVKPQQIVGTALGSASCGFNFTLGKQYVVFAYLANGRLETNICTKTQLANNLIVKQIKDSISRGNVPITVAPPAPTPGPAVMPRPVSPIPLNS